jgi:hypothetical protein
VGVLAGSFMTPPVAQRDAIPQSQRRIQKSKRGVRVSAVAVVEKFLTIPEISAQLRIDRHTVVSMFAGERGVIVIGNGETTKKQRKYRQLRVPQSVFNRVIARITVR